MKLPDTNIKSPQVRKWIASRPPHIKANIKQWPPDRLYLLTSSGHRVTIHSYSDDGKHCQVDVLGKYNLLTMERRVFGVKLADLVECDLPEADEPVGAVYTEDAEIDAFLKRVREGKAGVNAVAAEQVHKAASSYKDSD